MEEEAAAAARTCCCCGRPGWGAAWPRRGHVDDGSDARAAAAAAVIVIGVVWGWGMGGTARRRVDCQLGVDDSGREGLVSGGRVCVWWGGVPLSLRRLLTTSSTRRHRRAHHHGHGQHRRDDRASSSRGPGAARGGAEERAWSHLGAGELPCCCLSLLPNARAKGTVDFVRGLVLWYQAGRVVCIMCVRGGTARGG